MKHKIRVAALMLSLILCIGAFAVPVSAMSDEDGSTVEETAETEEINEEPQEEPEAEPEPEEAPAEESESEPEVKPEPEPVAAEEAVPEESADNGLTPEGNLTLVDDYGTATGEGKQFITLVTKSGNYFYLITPFYLRRNIQVQYATVTAEWRISGKSDVSYNDVAAYTTFGTARANAYKILEETLNLKDVRIYDTVEDAEGKQKRILNKKETTLAQQKQQAIKNAFSTWVWKEPQRREALVTKRLYHQKTGLDADSDVIAYQIRQSFKPGEITPEEANRLGYETAMRWTKGKHAFVVATHTDKAHIHNHIIYNSTTLDGLHKYRDFLRSGLALQRVSDTVCIEAGLSIITPRPQLLREKQTYDQNTFRNAIRQAIDDALRKEPQDFEAFLRLLREAGYEIKTGKYTAVKGTGQQRFIRFRSLGAGYTDEEIRAVIAGKAVHRPKQKSIQVHQVVRFSLIFDLQQKLEEKGPAYERWASVFNLKQMANVMLFLNENHIDSMEALVTQAEDMHQRTDALQAQLRQCDDRLSEIKALKTNIINYSKTSDTYVAYRKAGYSKKFLEAHREDILIHKAAKQAFEGLKHIPRVKELNAEYAQIQAKRSELRSELQAARKKSWPRRIFGCSLRRIYVRRRRGGGNSRGRYEYIFQLGSLSSSDIAYYLVA